jgi:ubiquinone/menaquinone biosynthesis C-methylase UbiE
MAWYDFFSNFYDKSLERLYVDQRAAAADALELRPGSVVLDLPCGTGQSFDGIAPKILPGGSLLGTDLSPGMLARAKDRVAKNGWNHVCLLQGDVHGLGREAVASALGRPARIDRLHIFLGLSAFPDWERAFEHLWDLLEPGGRCVVVDVHAERMGLQSYMVNWVARAEIRRRFWEPLERIAKAYRRVELPSRPEHGGKIFLATGVKS